MQSWSHVWGIPNCILLECYALFISRYIFLPGLVFTIRRMQRWSLTSVLANFRQIAGRKIFDLEQFIEFFDSSAVYVPRRRMPVYLNSFLNIEVNWYRHVHIGLIMCLTFVTCNCKRHWMCLGWLVLPEYWGAVLRWGGESGEKESERQRGRGRPPLRCLARAAADVRHVLVSIRPQLEVGC